jgi:mono/diheme cytochrome c family protein
MALERRRNLRLVILVVAAVALLGAAVVVVVAPEDSAGKAPDGRGPITLTSQEQRGRQLFADHCANCHTLQAANAVGETGPSLDMLRPAAPATLPAIRNGAGPMPANLVTGRDADAVAQFVAAVTAH